ncbi:MAG: dCTP deaminase [Trueperaceae bacterium]
MSIRPDWWIRQRALEGMIDPFTDRQERRGVISYGLSSFGYDLRAAPEWRIFVNAFNTIVDPKHFDTRSLVEHEGDECIIPPNSFVLTRSVEYLRIPDDTMVVALGKSSYARCFRGDTRVALVDGTARTLETMADEARDGALHFGYALGANGQLIAALLDAPRFVGRDSLLEIVLDDGAVIHATPDHRFMLRDGFWTTAGELTPGTSLMPLYRDVFRGYEMTYQPLAGTYTPTHRLTDAWNVRNGVDADAPRTRRHPQRPPRTAAIHLNHKVASVRSLKGEEDVYCLTVPEAGNFALEAGVFVSNCGIVANVTPLEPGWEGHVTLELSNTTPLPAKVYGNEGIVQLLFFQGDRPEVTYGDRKGKYQGQTGITLPRLGDDED